MRKILITVTTILALMIIVFLHEKISAGSGFGPSAMLALTFLGIVFVIFLFTVLLYNTRYREFIIKSWMVILSIFMTYIIVEILASYLFLKPLSPPLIPDEVRHHKLIPNTNSYFEQKDFTYIQRVNNFGLRGKDIKIKKEPDKYRILMLGDSFTMGKGVEDNETFSVLLEDSLNKIGFTIDSKSIEVLNCGVDSYAPILSYLQLKNDLTPLEPDMIILNIDNSDLVQETVYRNQAKFDSDGDIIAVPGSRDNLNLTDKIRNWTERNLYITRLLFYYINKLFDYQDFSVRSMVTQANFEIAKHTLAEDKEDREQQWINIFDSIMKIKNYCDNAKIDFLITVYPWGHQVNENEWLPGRYNFIPENTAITDKSIEIIKNFTQENNIKFKNFFPAFRSYTGKEKLFFNYDNHMTKIGYGLLAKEFVKYFLNFSPTE